MSKSDNPLSPGNVAAYDQAMKLMAESLPPFWRELYKGCIDQGFRPDDALELVKTQIMAMGTSAK